MHYAFALVAAFLATAVVASPHVKYEYKTVTVHNRHGSYRGWRHSSHRGWRYKHHQKPKKESSIDDDSTDPVQRYDDFPYPGEGSGTDSYPGFYYGQPSGEKDDSKEKKDDPKEKKDDPKEKKDDPKDNDSSGDSSSGSGTLVGSCLKAHNEKRAIHGAGPLEWDSTLAGHAESVSGTCVFKHSGDSYGENLAAGYPTAEKAIQAWYDENTMYQYNPGGFGEGTGHFTQMVWKGAKKIGCAIKQCDGSNGTPGLFLTCNYDTGNVIGQFEENVLPPKGA